MAFSTAPSRVYPDWPPRARLEWGGTVGVVGTPTAVLGAGSFGTCLAMLSARDHDVKIWSRREDVAESINRDRRNSRYLSNFELPDRIEATTDLRDALAGRELVIIAVPEPLPARRHDARRAPYVEPGAIVVSAVKGIEFETGLDHARGAGGGPRRGASPPLGRAVGPVLRRRDRPDRQPTVVTLACREEAYRDLGAGNALNCPWFRCYTHQRHHGRRDRRRPQERDRDRRWACRDGHGRPGHNARAALMTRGLAEITRIGVALGAEPETFLGLAGMGDLLLTCTGDLSRNRRVGPGPRPGPQARRDRGGAGRGRGGRSQTTRRRRAGWRSGWASRRRSRARSVCRAGRGRRAPLEAGHAPDDAAAAERAGSDTRSVDAGSARLYRSHLLAPHFASTCFKRTRAQINSHLGRGRNPLESLGSRHFWKPIFDLSWRARVKFRLPHPNDAARPGSPRDLCPN